MFKDLPGHYQRGILLEASIRYQGHQLSKYNKINDSEQRKEDFIKATCEKLVPKAEYYHKIESEMLYNNPMKKDRIEYIKRKAKAYSILLDQSYLINTKQRH